MSKKRERIIIWSILLVPLVISLALFIVAIIKTPGMFEINTNTYYTFRMKRTLFKLCLVFLFLSFAYLMKQLYESGPNGKITKIIVIVIASVLFCIFTVCVSLFVYFRFELDTKEYFIKDPKNGKEYCAVVTSEYMYDIWCYEYQYDYFEYKRNLFSYKLTPTTYRIYTGERFFTETENFVPNEEQNGKAVYTDGSGEVSVSMSKHEKINKKYEEYDAKQNENNSVTADSTRVESTETEAAVTEDDPALDMDEYLEEVDETQYFIAVQNYLLTKGALAGKRADTTFSLDFDTKETPYATVMKEKEKDGDKTHVTEHILKFYKYEENGKICKILYSTLDYTKTPESEGYTPTETMITFFEVNTETLEVTDTESIVW